MPNSTQTPPQGQEAKTRRQRHFIIFGVPVIVAILSALVLSLSELNKEKKVQIAVTEEPALELTTEPLPPEPEPFFAETDSTTLSYTDTESGVTFTVETDNPGKKGLRGKADNVTKKTKHVELFIEKHSVPSVTVKVSGLNPNTQYHLYKDGYENHQAFLADAAGSYTFTQDTSTNHHVWVQDEEQIGTVYLPAQCSSYGTWDSVNRICTLTADIPDTVQITESHLTFNLNFKKIGTPYHYFSLYIPPGITGVTIKKGIIEGVYSVYAVSAKGITFEGITFKGQWGGIIISGGTDIAVFSSSFSVPWGSAMEIVYGAKNIEIGYNQISGRHGINIYGSSWWGPEYMPSYVNIHDNNVAVYWAGISVTDAFDLKVLENTITSRYTIFLHNVERFDVSKNKMHCSYYACITAQYSVAGKMTDNAIRAGYPGTRAILLYKGKGISVERPEILLTHGAWMGIANLDSETTFVGGKVAMSILEYGPYYRPDALFATYGSYPATVMGMHFVADREDVVLLKTDTKENKHIYFTAQVGGDVTSSRLGNGWTFTNTAVNPTRVFAIGIDEKGNAVGGFGELSAGASADFRYLYSSSLSPTWPTGFALKASPGVSGRAGWVTWSSLSPAYGINLQKTSFPITTALTSEVIVEGDVLSAGSNLNFILPRLKLLSRLNIDFTALWGTPLTLLLDTKDIVGAVVELSKLSLTKDLVTGVSSFEIQSSSTTTPGTIVQVNDAGVITDTPPGGSYVTTNDPDKDGFPNDLEAQLGSNPLDPTDPVKFHAHKGKVLVDLRPIAPSRITRWDDYVGFDVKAVDPTCASGQPNDAAAWNCPAVPVLKVGTAVVTDIAATSNVYYIRKGTHRFIVADTFPADYPPANLPITSFDGKTVTLSPGLNDIDYGRPFINVRLADGTLLPGGGGKMVVKGSELIIEYPLQLYYDETAAKYLSPFVFTSADAWTTDVCARVPTGYRIVNEPCQQTFVAGETKMALFEFVATGSPPPEIEARIKARGPSGRMETLTISVKGIATAKGIIPAPPKEKAPPFRTP